MIGEKFNMPRVEAGKSAEFLPEPTICFINHLIQCSSSIRNGILFIQIIWFWYISDVDIIGVLIQCDSNRLKQIPQHDFCKTWRQLRMKNDD
mmetsp:Transcript_26465/g.52733  ORF Transcript_26465/g.52733 Transcript_26465/m.52733 type:complete len:92 (-) Transcript_26465:40-315(-)